MTTGRDQVSADVRYSTHEVYTMFGCFGVVMARTSSLVWPAWRESGLARPDPDPSRVGEEVVVLTLDEEEVRWANVAAQELGKPSIKGFGSESYCSHGPGISENDAPLRKQPPPYALKQAGDWYLLWGRRSCFSSSGGFRPKLPQIPGWFNGAQSLHGMGKLWRSVLESESGGLEVADAYARAHVGFLFRLAYHLVQERKRVLTSVEDYKRAPDGECDGNELAIRRGDRIPTKTAT